MRTFCYELYHHGIKGQRWYVRRTKEELGYQRTAEKEKFSAITSGEVTLKVKRECQARHIRNSAGYIKGRSYLFVKDLSEAQALIHALSGTGSAVHCRGTWQHKERVKSSRYIGVYVDPVTGDEIKTRRAMIIYSKSGSHIIPIRR